SQDVIHHAAPEQPRLGPQGISFRLTPGNDRSLGAGSLTGVVTFESADGTRAAVEIEATPGAPLAGTDTAPAPTDEIATVASFQPGPAQATPIDFATLAGAVVFAFLGGLLLNIMPCVLPVLSVKALALVASTHREQVRREGVLYFAGVLATFLAL